MTLNSGKTLNDAISLQHKAVLLTRYASARSQWNRIKSTNGGEEVV